MINGAHCIVYSKDPEADRVFFRDVLQLPDVDTGGGWIIFALPPSELAVHPSGQNNTHEIFLMCDDLDRAVSDLVDHNVSCIGITSESWGRVTRLKLPGGGTLGLYEPSHARPEFGK